MEDTKLECLRLAVEYVTKTNDGEIMATAEQFYKWVSGKSNNKIVYEKTER